MSFFTEVRDFFGFGPDAPMRHELPLPSRLDRGYDQHSGNGGDYTHRLKEQQEPRYDHFDDGDPIFEVGPHTRDFENTGLRNRVWDYMVIGQWRTLADINFYCGGTEASCSARLRDFRKAQFGAHVVDRRHVRNRLYEYRLTPRKIQ
jgi:hypothetical protein